MTRSQRHLREVQGYDSSGYDEDGADGGPPPFEPQLQIVSTRGEVHHALAGARTAANNLQVARTRHYVGSVAVTDLRPVFQDYYIPDALSEVNGGGYTVRFNIEYNGLSVRGAFGGARDGVIPAGSSGVIADPVPASLFGLENFPAGAQFWLRAERQYAVGAVSLFGRTTAYTVPITNERFMSAAAGSASLLDATGVLSASGPWTAQTHVWLPLCILGMPIAPMMSVAVIGASIEHGSNDQAGDGDPAVGGGFFRRALFNVSGKKIARISLAKPGEAASDFVNANAKRLAMMPYVTHAFVGYGGNDYTNGSSLATTLGRLETIWAAVRSAGAPWVAQVVFAPKTDSTDSWATVANQTPRTGFAVGAPWYAANAAFATNPLLDGAVNVRAAMVDATAVDKWKAPGATTDGTHPSLTIHTAMATSLAPLLEAWRAEHEGA